MTDSKQHNPIELVGEAYKRMLERAMEDFKHAEEKTGPVLHKLIDKAKNRAVELEELSVEEAERLSGYLKRDLIDAADHMVDTGADFKDWLGFETRLIESELFDLFLHAADKTTVELLALKDKAIEASTYHTGEVAGPGTLVCQECGEILHFHGPGKIPPCAKCHGSVFQRDR